MNKVIEILHKCYRSKKFFLNLNKENDFTKLIKKEFDMTTQEANIFGFILYWYIKENSYVLINDICKELKITQSQYLNIIKIISSLEKKGFIITHERGIRSRILNPEIEIDEIIFKKLILGEDILKDCDFSNIYSIINTIKELIDLKEDNTISLRYFEQLMKNIFKKINKNISLFDIIKRCSFEETILFFYVLIKTFNSWSNEIELGDFADFMGMTFKRKMEFIEKIISNKLSIFKEEYLEIVKGESSIFNSSTDIEIALTNKSINMLFNISKITNHKFNSSLLKHLSVSQLKDKKILFFKNELKREIAKIQNFLLPNKFNKIKIKLKEKGFSPGMVMLFYGSPGTGKTATAYEIAKMTGRDILQVDFSQVQSMWVGESEKNMKKIFKEYREAISKIEFEPILLFNEADSLISKRIDIRDSVDQMNNTLQNILLEELENFEGIFIATTNLIDNIDSAFDRRFTYKLKFEIPDKEIREKIWQNKLPELSIEDIKKLSEFKLSGGQIDNIVKKIVITRILEDKKLNFSEILKYVNEEIYFREENRKIIGF